MAAALSDGNLLFGILALQNGLIGQPDLIAAFQSWTLERTQPMAQVLVERGALSEADRAMIEGLAQRYLEKRGEPSGPRPDPSKSANGTDRDDEAGRPKGVGSGDLTRGVALESSVDESLDWSFSLGQTTSDGGRFRLLRRHARGGIGVVFVAMDSELHREVALKQIQPQHADDPTSRARFLIEAEVTGRLEHPGVVPVYGLGHERTGAAVSTQCDSCAARA